ncbi:hypothetical protein F5Y03DRAFT_393053 [Xylaria venustula]|nr:hypothetical protein F5Y03DRAFT_393053 [Xylaria venustula]
MNKTANYMMDQQVQPNAHAYITSNPQHVSGMTKRAKVKSKIDYRHRWPTQQTLVESRPARRTLGLKRRWDKLHAGWQRRLKRRSSREPGKSTHPYDTGLGEQRSDSGSASTPTSASTEDGQRC